jgi:hypothetical protein
MRLFHATQEANVTAILKEGFHGTTCGDVDELQEDSGISEIVFYSDSMDSLVEEFENCYFVRPEVVLEVEVENPFHVNGRMMIEHEWIGEVFDAEIIAIHWDGSVYTPDEW